MAEKTQWNPTPYGWLLTGLTVLIAPWVVVDPALAQSDGAAALEEILVTAQRREESLQDVPISVTALRGEAFDSIFDAGSDIRALATRIPSVYAESSNGRYAPRFYIRGFGNADFGLGASQPVLIVMDEVVHDNVILKGFPLFDIEQVEVLRGPQGTLFGRNTPAGIIKFDSRKPTDEFEATLAGSYGTHNASVVDLAVGGPLSDRIRARLAAQINTRDDFINNGNSAAGFVGDGDEMGGYEDYMARAIVEFDITDIFNATLSLQGRDLDGTSSIFRANVLSTGSNELNENFDRDTVYFDGGQNNTQEQQTFSSTLKLQYSRPDFDITSITAFISGDGFSIGDIDGGTGAVFLPTGSFPGDIPFPSESASRVDGVDQFTQEIRIATTGEDSFRWQGGLFLFDEELETTDIGLDGFGGEAPTALVSQNQTSESWAVFAQGEFDLTDQVTLIGGLRYTDDDKTLQAQRTLGGPTGPLFPPDTNVSDEQVSWDLSLLYELNEDVNLYGRIARGYRGPSIQGRITFGDTITTADSETNLSFEGGIKAALLDGRARLNAGIFHYRVDDIQFTAIGGAANTNRLVNSERAVGQGVELELEVTATDWLRLAFGLGYNDTELQDNNLRVAVCGAPCTILDPVDTDGFALIDGNPFPNAPEMTANLSARYSMPVGRASEFFVYTDWAYQGETNFFLYESEEFRSDGNFEGGLRAGWVIDDGRYEVVAFGRNITDERNLLGGVDFNNLTGFVNEPRTFGLQLVANFR